MRHQVIFVACGKLKKQYTCRAKEMYIGQYFRIAYKYSLALQKLYPESVIFILSGKYGVTHPDKKIAPYDHSVTNMSKAELHEWHKKIKKQMKKLEIWFLPKIFVCGKLYQGSLKGKNVFPKGLRIEAQKKYLRNKMDKRKTLL